MSASPPPRPSYGELAALVQRQAKQIDDQAALINELSATITALTAEIAELRRRLEMDSPNSSKPPSADGQNTYIESTAVPRTNLAELLRQAPDEDPTIWR